MAPAAIAAVLPSAHGARNPLQAGRAKRRDLIFPNRLEIGKMNPRKGALQKISDF
jgi:hypothetical protein